MMGQSLVERGSIQGGGGKDSRDEVSEFGM